MPGSIWIKKEVYDLRLLGITPKAVVHPMEHLHSIMNTPSKTISAMPG